MRLAVATFGCRSNQLDSDVLLEEAQRRGFQVVSEEDSFDAIIINSCTVTETADKEARKKILQIRRRHPTAKVALVGCYPQVTSPELLSKLGVDAIAGTSNKAKVLDQLLSEKPDFNLEPATGFFAANFTGSQWARAPIKIQDGCNYRCSYCIIPKARGRSRSLPVSEVLRQVNQAIEMGYEELVLTGIHLAHYGWDHGTDLANLVSQLLELPGGPRIRLSTLDPFEIDPILPFLKHPRFCPYLHIALQSGSNRVLKAMRRLYLAEEFAAITEKIQSLNPDCFIGVDVIVGFPSETEQEFEETVQLLKKTFWAKLHVFPFSKRQGTEAERIAQNNSNEILKYRSKILRGMSDARYHAFLDQSVGTIKTVCLERELGVGIWFGHTENYLPVSVSLESGQAKKLYPVKIMGRNGDSFLGCEEAEPTKQSHSIGLLRRFRSSQTQC